MCNCSCKSNKTLGMWNSIREVYMAEEINPGGFMKFIFRDIEILATNCEKTIVLETVNFKKEKGNYLLGTLSKEILFREIWEASINLMVKKFKNAKKMHQEKEYIQESKKENWDAWEYLKEKLNGEVYYSSEKNVFYMYIELGKNLFKLINQENNIEAYKLEGNKGQKFIIDLPKNSPEIVKHFAEVLIHDLAKNCKNQREEEKKDKVESHCTLSGKADVSIKTKNCSFEFKGEVRIIKIDEPESQNPKKEINMSFVITPPDEQIKITLENLAKPIEDTFKKCKIYDEEDTKIKSGDIVDIHGTKHLILGHDKNGKTVVCSAFGQNIVSTEFFNKFIRKGIFELK